MSFGHAKYSPTVIGLLTEYYKGDWYFYFIFFVSVPRYMYTLYEIRK